MTTDASTLNPFIAENTQDTLNRCAAAADLLGQLFVDFNESEGIGSNEASALSLFGRCVGAALRYEVERCALEHRRCDASDLRASV